MSDFDLHKYKSKADRKWVYNLDEEVEGRNQKYYCPNKGGRGKCQEILLEKEIQVYL